MLKFYDEIEQVNSIEMYPFLETYKEKFVVPNYYYINADGLLYNCFGADAHKETNLIYTYEKIKDAFYDVKYVSLNDDGKVSLKKILCDELKTYKRIIESGSVTRLDSKKYLHLDCCDLSDPLVVKIIVGVVSSKIILLNKFIELESSSNNKYRDMDKIIRSSKNDLTDILVRYCGFHKIEAQREKTITTSSLDLNSFVNYLDRDYTIEILPRITLYDHKQDAFMTVSVDKFLDKNPQYEGKITTAKQFTLFDGERREIVYE